LVSISFFQVSYTFQDQYFGWAVSVRAPYFVTSGETDIYLYKFTDEEDEPALLLGRWRSLDTGVFFFSGSNETAECQIPEAHPENCLPECSFGDSLVITTDMEVITSCIDSVTTFGGAFCRFPVYDDPCNPTKKREERRKPKVAHKPSKIEKGEPDSCDDYQTCQECLYNKVRNCNW